MAIVLTDDGTLDTVLRCTECGEEFRGNYDNVGDPFADEPTDAEAEAAYDEWVADFICEVEDEHDCTAAPTEPDVDDITTTDHRKFYQNGKRAFEVAETPAGRFVIVGAAGAIYDTVEAAVRAYMDRVQFWPDCWFISDHGNAHLMDLSQPEGK